MQRLIILHTNDIHGRVEGLSRIATLVSQIKAENPDVPVLYFDCGDIEEPSQHLSNVTKGAAMHRLLSIAGCDAAVTGNGAWLRYGPEIVGKHAAEASYPLLVANLRKANGSLLEGAHATAIVEAGGLRVGLIGVTALFPDHSASFGIDQPPVEPLVRQLAAQLKSQGGDFLVVLSHLGLPADRELAAQLAGEASLILGAHTHDLLPEGELIDGVTVAQAGQYAEHLGRIDLVCDGGITVSRVGVMPVTDDIPPAPAILAEAERIEAAGRAYLNEVIGELAEPLNYAVDRECGVVNLMADVLRERMQAELAVVAAGQAFTGPLPAGPLRRGALWEVCNSTANPALVELTGEQLGLLLAKGLNPAFAAEQTRPLRGHPRGLFHISGGTIREGLLFIGDAPLDPQRTYRVAGSDWEFERYGGYAPQEWALQPQYDMPKILREAVEDYLAGRGPVSVATGRLGELQRLAGQREASQ